MAEQSHAEQGQSKQPPRFSKRADITKRTVELILPDPDGDLVVWDTKLKGFGVRVKPSGVKSFIVQYRNSERQSKRYTIGQYGVLTVKQARDQAEKTLSEAKLGGDPASRRQAKLGEDTVKAFADEYLSYARDKRKISTVRGYTYHLEVVIVPKLGTRKLTGVTREDVVKLHRSLKEHPYQANRVLATFRHMYTVAGEWGRVPFGFNPCRGIKGFTEQKRKRVLTAAEFVRMSKALDDLEAAHPAPVRAIWLLLLTGCRLGEILTLRWSDVDLDHRVLSLRDAKAGPREHALGAPSATFLANCERNGEWVIPSVRRKGAHVSNLHDFWYNDLLPAAQLEGLRLHDLRHTVGGTAAGLGLSMKQIADHLGHSQTATTERYAHLAEDVRHQSADKIENEIMGLLRGDEPAEVVELRPMKRRG